MRAADGVPSVPVASFVLLLLCVAAPSSAQHEGIAAIVGAPTPRRGATVILLSDVELRARIRLAGEMREGLPLGPLPERLLRATLEELLGEVLIAREAERVRVATPDEEDVRVARRRIEQMAGGAPRLRALLDALGARDDEVREAAERQALVRVFLEANLQGESAVSDDEIDRVYAEGQHPFLGQELEDVRDAMRVWLGRRAVRDAVERWVGVLRTRTRFRLLAPWATEAR